MDNSQERSVEESDHRQEIALEQQKTANFPCNKS